MSAREAPIFDAGDRVTWKGRAGVVMFRRMAPPDYAAPESYSVKFDDADHAGAIVPAGEVRAAPTPFGRERAAELWEARGIQNTVHPTPGERAYVNQVWDTLSGSSCWMDAFFLILQGKVEVPR